MHAATARWTCWFPWLINNASWVSKTRKHSKHAIGNIMDCWGKFVDKNIHYLLAFNILLQIHTFKSAQEQRSQHFFLKMLSLQVLGNKLLFKLCLRNRQELLETLNARAWCLVKWTGLYYYKIAIIQDLFPRSNYEIK